MIFSVKRIFFILVYLSVLPAILQAKSNIPEIDSLPVHDWDVPTPPLSYAKALGWSLAFPGGGQIYGRHNVRAGFLIGLEGLLLFDAGYSKHLLMVSKNREIRVSLDSARAAMDAYYSVSDSAGGPADYETYIGKARLKLDVKLKNLDLRKSEFAWALGLHFYGVMDAMEIVYRSRLDSAVRLSGSTAFWWGIFIPGGGQLYNGRFGKFGMLWMALGSSAASSVFRQEMVVHFQNRLRIARKESTPASDISEMEKELTLYRKRRNQYFWGMALLHLYAVGDAVVDAVLNDFDTPDKFALTPGPEPFSIMLTCSF